MFRRRSSQHWPWEYGVGRGPGGDLQFERHRVPPLSVQNQALQADLILANHYLVQEKANNVRLQRQLQEAEQRWRACEQEKQNLETQIANLEADYDRLDERNQKANNKIRELKRERRRLREEIEFFEYYEGVDTRRRLALQRQLNQMEADLRERIQRANELRQQLTATERELDAVRVANNVLRMNIADKKAEITQLREDLEYLYWYGPNRI